MGASREGLCSLEINATCTDPIENEYQKQAFPFNGVLIRRVVAIPHSPPDE